MMENRYVKADGERSLSVNMPSHFSGNNRSPELKIIDYSNISSDYLKIGKERNTAFFVIISGGEKREKQYFSPLFDNIRFRRIRIKFITKPKEGIQKISRLIAIADAEKNSLSDSENPDIPDSYFIVTDRDHFEPEIRAKMFECKTKGYSLIVSNPCFEVWLYYGYFSERPKKEEIPCTDIKQMSSAFKRFLGNKVKGGCKPSKEIFKIETAVMNSKSNYIFDETGFPELFSTDMHVLAEAILPYIVDILHVPRCALGLEKD